MIKYNNEKQKIVSFGKVENVEKGWKKPVGGKHFTKKKLILLNT